MPTIKQYGPSRVTTQVTRQPTARDAPAGAFGGAVAKGLGDAAIEYERVQDDISTTEARAALNSFQKTEMSILTDPETGYYGKSGNNAYSGAQPTLKSLADLKGTLGKTLSDSARKKFEESADQRIASASMNVNRHAARGYKEWKNRGFDDEIENNLEEASMAYDNEEQFNRAREAGAQAVYEKATLAGLDPKEATETYRAEFVKNGVLAAINESSAKGEEILAKHVEQLGGEGPTYDLLKGKIAAKKQAEQTAYETTYALNKSTAVNDRYGSDRNAIRDEVNAITDPVLREKTMKQSMVEFNRRETANDEARVEVYKAAQVAVNEEGGLNAWIAQNSEAWLSLEPLERQKLESGKMVETDWNKYIELQLLPQDELAQINPAKYTTVFSESELSKLTSSVKQARQGETGVGRSRAATVSSYLESVVGKKKSSWNDDDRRMSNSFQRFLAVEERALRDEKQSPLTEIEFDQMLNRITSKYIIEGKMNFNDEDQFLDEEVTFETFKDDNVSKYTEWLRGNGLEVNMKNLGLARRKNVLKLE
tara:strand:- start:19086 stop:20702 length:1617 start_codon:yes stop_codon:yes gene_type:complete